MTSLLERIVAIIAPHQCLSCSIENNNIICNACLNYVGGTTAPCCVGCGVVSRDSKTCEACIGSTKLAHVWVGGEYDGALAQAIKKFKFERAQVAATALAQVIAAQLPVLPASTIIVPLPTATNRVRQRGYDQAALLARALAKELGHPVKTPLARLHDTRQVGASKNKRLRQADKAFYVTKPELCQDANILLVDDVLTTGASLTAAAQLLGEAGARSVGAAVVARQAATDVI